MAKTESKFTTSVRVRFPKELLAALDHWAALNRLDRSVAVRRLILRTMADWTDEGGADANQREWGEPAGLQLEMF
jgi:hypothetical protein